MKQSLFAEIQEMLQEGEDISEHLFAFDPKDLDRTYVTQLIDAVRGLLARPDVRPLQVHSLARLLLGLQRLPLGTPGLDVTVELTAPEGDASDNFEIALNADRLFVLAHTGDDGVDAPFEVDVSYRSDTQPADMAWLASAEDAFAGRKVIIQDFSDGKDLDWEHDDGAELWQYVPQLEDEFEE